MREKRSCSQRAQPFSRGNHLRPGGIVRMGNCWFSTAWKQSVPGWESKDTGSLFHTDQKLDYEHSNGHYIFRTGNVDGIARMLETVSANGWTLIDLSVRESALEEIYVKLMTNS